MNVASTTDATRIARTFLGRGRDDVIAMPNLVDIQLSSYERFLQRQVLAAGQQSAHQGLEEVFQEMLAMAGIEGTGLPGRMAEINEVLNALPVPLRERLLVEYLNELFRRPGAGG